MPVGSWLALEEGVADRLARGGPIPFADFMEAALYTEPSSTGEGGYYSAGKVKIGPGGDFFSAPELHSPELGQGMCRYLAERWVELGRPGEFTVVEMGGGNGTLARDLLREAPVVDPRFAESLHYVLVDVAAALLGRQRASVAGLGSVGLVHGSAPFLPFGGVTGCFLSNELVDAFPFHRVVFEGGEPLEIYVGFEDGEFYETALELSSPELADVLERWESHPPDGVEVSVSLLAERWMAEVGKALDRGWVITIDYGFIDREAARVRGIPTRFFGNQAILGEFDMTTDVDFAALTEAGRRAGLVERSILDEVDFTAGWARYELGHRGHGGRARYVLVQEKATPE